MLPSGNRTWSYSGVESRNTWHYAGTAVPAPPSVQHSPTPQPPTPGLHLTSQSTTGLTSRILCTRWFSSLKWLGCHSRRYKRHPASSAITRTPACPVVTSAPGGAPVSAHPSSLTHQISTRTPASPASNAASSEPACPAAGLKSSHRQSSGRPTSCQSYFFGISVPSWGCLR